MKFVAALLFVFTFATAAQSSDIVKKSYRFSLDRLSSEADCCAPRLYFKNLDSGGTMKLGGVTLGVEESSFIAVAEYTVARTTLYTSVDSDISGRVSVRYVFKCSPSKNTGCPKSGSISVPFSMPIKCGQEGAKVYTRDYDWEPTGLQLAKMITERPVGSDIKGTAHVSVRKSGSCK